MLSFHRYYYIIDSDIYLKQYTQSTLLYFHCELFSQTRHSFTLYVNCLSCYVYHPSFLLSWQRLYISSTSRCTTSSRKGLAVAQNKLGERNKNCKISLHINIEHIKSENGLYTRSMRTKTNESQAYINVLHSNGNESQFILF